MRRILVIATRQIGDVLLTTPLIRAARERWPDARIDVLGLAGTLEMLRGNPDVAALIEAPRRSGWRKSIAFARGLWRRYDLALVAEQSDRAHAYALIAAPRRAGLVTARWLTSWWKRLLLEHAVVVAGDRGSTHTVIEKLALIAPWTAGTAARSAVAVTADDGNAAPASTALVTPSGAPLPADLAAQLEAAYVVVHIPSMWRYKQWPVAHYRSLVQALLDDGAQVLLSGGPGAEDRAKVAALAALAPPPRLIDVCGRLDLAQMALLLRGAALYIGPDTSITHLAAACGVPVIALFGPTNPMRWGPWPPQANTAQPYVRYRPEQRAGKVIVLQGEALCAPGVPCGRAGCEDHQKSASLCLESGLPPERVIAQARRLLAGQA